MPVTTSASSTRSTLRPTFPDTLGERLEADARLIVAPGSGVFEPARDFRSGNQINAGQVIGHLTTGSQSVPVVSPFSGQTGDALAWSGERLSAYQPVMWLSVDAGTP